MATLKTVRWVPDTCPKPGCTLLQTYDVDTSPPTFVSGQVEARCAIHPTQTYDDIALENRIKNFGIAAIEQVLAGQGITVLNWTFDVNRNCIITTSAAMTNQQKTQARNAVKTIFQDAGLVISDANVAKVLVVP